MVVTKGGDVIEVLLQEKRNQVKNRLTYEFVTHRNSNIFQLHGDLKAMCIQEREDDNIIYVGGSNAYICAFSLTTHEVIDI